MEKIIEGGMAVVYERCSRDERYRLASGVRIGLLECDGDLDSDLTIIRESPRGKLEDFFMKYICKVNPGDTLKAVLETSLK